MSEQSSNRRNFLKLLGLSAGATLVSASGVAAFTNSTEIKVLSPEQQEFMIRYGKWMDEFTELIRLKKEDPENLENNKKTMALAEKAESFQPELKKFMSDKTFELIYKESIKRVSIEI